jgi:hypothetical protein
MSTLFKECKAGLQQELGFFQVSDLLAFQQIVEGCNM